MRENMVEMTRQELDVPVMLGGAALTRQYVEQDCVEAYGAGRVAYARDAFDGLHLMDRIVSGDFDGYLAERQEQRQGEASPQEDLAYPESGQRQHAAAGLRGRRGHAAGRRRGNQAAAQRAVARH